MQSSCTIPNYTTLHYRADESGIPFCITVDFDSLTDDSVTVRERDSMVQTRMKIMDVLPYLSKQIDGF
jgi:glycyl-tRNA synthetase